MIDFSKIGQVGFFLLPWVVAGEAVHPDNAVALGNQPFRQRATDESGRAGHDRLHLLRSEASEGLEGLAVYGLRERQRDVAIKPIVDDLESHYGPGAVPEYGNVVVVIGRHRNITCYTPEGGLQAFPVPGPFAEDRPLEVAVAVVVGVNLDVSRKSEVKRWAGPRRTRVVTSIPPSKSRASSRIAGFRR